MVLGSRSSALGLGRRLHSSSWPSTGPYVCYYNHGFSSNPLQTEVSSWKALWLQKTKLRKKKLSKPRNSFFKSRRFSNTSLKTMMEPIFMLFRERVCQITCNTVIRFQSWRSQWRRCTFWEQSFAISGNWTLDIIIHFSLRLTLIKAQKTAKILNFKQNGKIILRISLYLKQTMRQSRKFNSLALNLIKFKVVLSLSLNTAK